MSLVNSLKYFLLTDLLFKSKIRAIAGNRADLIRFFSSARELLQAVEATPPAYIFIDLNDSRTQPLEAVQMLVQKSLLQDVQLYGYLSHVDRALAQQAEQAGCPHVIPRSEFVSLLPRLFAEPAK
ncbi:MAG: hypothetical protein D6814_12275 [Calditrichaeota bacterium]|nr:MAG: hypothetical protein D6814_12275 [Calditrichota bacterium]